MNRTLPILLASGLVLLSCGTADRAVEQRQYNLGYGIVVTDETKTESVSTVKVDNTMSTYRSIYDYIQGRVPGVQVKGDKIYIRGINTVNSSTDPLILVDGVVCDDISWINPADVKSIDVLKDAASCSLYGARGANGVIIIHLK